MSLFDEKPEQPEQHNDVDPADDVADAAEAGTKTYKVVTRQRVLEVKRGGTLELDPADPLTQRLIDRGQIVPVNKED